MKNESIEKDIVLFFFGGGMAGTFAAGVVSEMESHGLQDRIHSGYGSSAGLFALLGFWCGQAKEISKIYWEKLDGKKYINHKRAKKYLWSIFTGKTTENRVGTRPLLDIDLIENILKTSHKLDLESFLSSPLYALTFNLKSNKHEWITTNNDKENILKILKASGGGQPGYPLKVEYNNKFYLDGDLFKNESLVEEIIKSNPDKKIICVINHNIYKKKTLLENIQVIFTLYLTSVLYNIPIENIERRGFISCDAVKDLKHKYKNVTFLVSPFNGLTTCTEKDLLIKNYDSGRKAFKDVAKKIISK